MKKILITGGTSFIGRNLIEQLKNKYEIFAPTRQEVDLINKQTVNNYFKKHSFDTFIHCALYIGPKKTEFAVDMLKKNLAIFFNLINNKKYFKKMIFFGSGAEYDRSQPLVNISEIEFDKQIPVDDYGVFKYTVSKYIQQTEDIINLRLFGIFGKYEDYKRRPISYAICRALKGRPIIIRQNAVYDYVFIDDLVQIVDYFISHKPRYAFYNVSSGHKIDFIAMANLVKKIIQKDVAIKLLHQVKQNEYTANNSRLLRELGNFKFADFEKSLSQLINWYKPQIDDIEVLDIT